MKMENKDRSRYKVLTNEEQGWFKVGSRFKVLIDEEQGWFKL